MKQIYCDGACQPNPGWMGLGFYVPHEREESISAGEGTNQRTELLALMKALEYAESGDEIISDSKYAIGVTKGQMKARRNLDLVDQAQKLYQDKSGVFLMWVHGHNGNIGNNRADELAQAAAKKIKMDKASETPARRLILGMY